MEKAGHIKKVRTEPPCGSGDGQGVRGSPAQRRQAQDVLAKGSGSEEAAGVAGLEPGMKLALYARVSTQMQEKEETVASQIAELVCDASRHGLEIPDGCRFVDGGYSGSALDRPALDALRDKVAEGAFDVVLVHDPDRLARNYVYQMLLVEEFERHGCRLHFSRRPIGRSPDELLLLQMQGVIAEYERAKIRERTRRGKLHRMRNGEIVAGRRTFGYKYFSRQGESPARFEIVPEEAEAIRKGFDWFAKGQASIRGVAARLNEEGAAKPLRGGQWTSSNIHNILRNSMYYGVGHANRVEAVLPTRDRPLQPVYRKYAKTGKRERPREEWLPFSCPSIIDQETYQLAQDRFARNKELSSRNTQKDYLLRGLIVCAECGRRFQASPQAGRYICAYTRRQMAETNGGVCCGNTMRPRIADLDAAVWKEVADLIKRPSTLRKYHKMLQGKILPKSCSDGDLVVRKERIEDRICRINDLYLRGDIDRSGHAEKIRAAKEELHKVTSRIDTLKEHHLEDDEIERMLQSFAAFSSSVKKEIGVVDFATRRHIVENMVKSIIMGKKDITIEFAAPLRKSHLCTTNREQ